MKAGINQITQDISVAIVDIILVEKINKKLEKSIEKASRKVAKKVMKVIKKEEKAAEKLAKKTPNVVVARIAKTKVTKVPIMKAIGKKPIATPKSKPAKSSIT
jgi:hypothetical protein